MEGLGRTAVDAGEEHLFNIGLRPGHGIDFKFVLERPLGHFSFMMAIVLAILVDDLTGFGNILAFLPVLGLSTGAEGWDELDATFVERQRVAEVQNGVIRAGERQVFRNQANRLYGIPARRYGVGD